MERNAKAPHKIDQLNPKPSKLQLQDLNIEPRGAHQPSATVC